MSKDDQEKKAREPKLTKPAKKKIAVIFDTNILFPVDKRNILSKFFFNFHNRFKGVIDLGLFVPDTVVMELKFQALQFAQVAFDSMIERTGQLAEMGLSIDSQNAKSGNKIAKADVEQAVNDTYNATLKKFDFKILTLPVSVFDILELRKLSVNRTGVFEAIRTGDGGKSIEVGEKGFRDILIQRTIEEFFKEISGFDDYVILCKDMQLSEELTKIPAPENTLIKVFLTTQDADVYFNTVRSSADKAWIDILTPLAALQFFDPVRESLWFTSVIGEIHKLFGEDIEKLYPERQIFDLRHNQWRKGNSNFYISRPQYRESSDQYYVWTSAISFKQQFTREEERYGYDSNLSSAFGQSTTAYPGALFSNQVNASNAFSLIPPPPVTEEATVSLDFIVTWSGKITHECEFSDLKVESIAKSGKK